MQDTNKHLHLYVSVAQLRAIQGGLFSYVVIHMLTLGKFCLGCGLGSGLGLAVAANAISRSLSWCSKAADLRLISLSVRPFLLAIARHCRKALPMRCKTSSACRFSRWKNDAISMHRDSDGRFSPGRNANACARRSNGSLLGFRSYAGDNLQPLPSRKKA